MAIDTYAGVTFIFFLVTVLAYFAALGLQYKNADGTNYRTTVLTTRAAFFLPGYALIFWISVCDPNAYSGLAIPLAIIEGYVFYVFFAMLVHNLGGPNEAVNCLVKTGKDYVLCGCCFPSKEDKDLFYRRNAWVMWHMLFTRTGLAIIGAICEYRDAKAGFLIVSIIGAVIVFTMIVHLVNFFEMAYPDQKNIYGIIKLLLMKSSIGVIVLEGIIANILITTNKQPYNDDDGDDKFDADDKTLRGYCALVLIELMIYSIFYVWAFGCVKVQPATAPGYNNAQDKAGETKTFAGFVCDVWKFWDVFGVLSLNTSASKEHLANTSNKV